MKRVLACALIFAGALSYAASKGPDVRTEIGSVIAFSDVAIVTRSEQDGKITVHLYVSDEHGIETVMLFLSPKQARDLGTFLTKAAEPSAPSK